MATAGALAVVAGGLWLFLGRIRAPSASSVSRTSSRFRRCSSRAPTPAGARSSISSWKQATSELFPVSRRRPGGRTAPTWRPRFAQGVGTSQLRCRATACRTTTTIHWHGMHLPAAADGGPHQLIEPGETWSPGWTIDQPAATLWYHPHPHRRTADHVYRGIAGMFILDEPDCRRAGASRRVRRRRHPPDHPGQEVRGQRLARLLQRADQPDRPARRRHPRQRHLRPLSSRSSTERVRLRLLNASNARVYNVGFADDRRVRADRHRRWPDREPRANRADPALSRRAGRDCRRLRAGREAVLRSYKPDLGTNFWDEQFAGGDDTFDLLEIRAKPTLAPSPEVPERLVPEEPLDESARGPDAALRALRPGLDQRPLDGHEPHRRGGRGRHDRDLGGRATHGGPPTTSIHDVSASGSSSTRAAAPAAPQRLEGHRLRTAERNGALPRPLRRDYTDPDLPYMLHCHILQHEDRGMMGQFVVVEPGQQPQSPPPTPWGPRRAQSLLEIHAEPHCHRSSLTSALLERSMATSSVPLRR